MPTTPISTTDEAERRLYGDLLPDVRLLRDRGHAVARFKGDYRIDRDVVTAAELRGRAAEVRKRLTREPATAAAPKPVAQQSPTPIAEPAPQATTPIAAPARAAAATSRPALTCTKCGGPRSQWSSTGICRACYTGGKQSAPQTRPAPTAEPANPFDAKADRLARELRGGATIREAARAAGVSTSTAHKHAERLTPPEALCGCGRPNSHNGRCWARRAQQSSNLLARVAELERQVAELMTRVGRVGEGR